MLPRLVPDTYVDTLEEAIAEVERRRRTAPMATDAFTRYAESPYGGFRVFTVSRSLAMEVLSGLAEHGLLVFPDGRSPLSRDAPRRCPAEESRINRARGGLGVLFG